MTTLSSLKKLPQAERATVLAQMIDRLAPTPNEAELSGESAAAVKNVERELLSIFGSNLFNSAELRTKALRLLSNAIRDISVPTASIKTIRDRVGSKGALALALYDVVFADSFANLNETLGISRSEVRTAIRNPDGTEHFVPEEMGQPGVEATTLVVKHTYGPDPYTLIVLASRTGAKLRVDGAWKSFAADVPTAPLEEPIAFLKAFIDAFGVPIKVNDMETKFIAYQNFPNSFGNRVAVSLAEPPKGSVDARFSYQLGPFKASVALAFAVDVEKYARSLKKHGVKITRNLANPGTQSVYVDSSNPQTRGGTSSRPK